MITTRSHKAGMLAGVALCGALALAACSGSGSAGTTDAEQVASDYLAAVNANDIPRVSELLRSSDGIDGLDASAHSRLMPLWQAQGWSTLNESCNEKAETPAGTLVVCTFDFHNLGSDEMGLGPYSDNFYELTVAGTLIVKGSSDLATETNGFDIEVGDPFYDWVQQSHPESAPRMFNEEEPTPETVALWEQMVAEYVATQNA